MPDPNPDVWKVVIECRLCHEVYEVLNPDYSREVIGPDRRRLVLITVPQECPRCHNLRSVS